jgi:PAS domain S-box-containing protein
MEQKSIFSFLQDGGEMGELTRKYNWSDTIVGSPEKWPQSLRSLVSLLLSSKFPMLLMWGEDLIQFYNDAFRPSLGNNGKHPTALGQGAEECWAEIWDVISPSIYQVLEGKGACWNENQLIPIYRNGRMEDVYWTYSYSPAYDEAGSIVGVLVVCHETTSTVLNLQQINIAKSKVEESERNLRNIILQAPVAMSILRGEDHVVEIANDRMFELWGKKPEVLIGKPIFKGLPEARSQGYEELLNHVFTTGETITANGSPVTLPREGGVKTAYINFVYEAFREPGGVISGIMVVATDVTEQVLSTKQIESSEARFRMMADVMPQFVWTANAKGELNYFNKAVYDYSGLNTEEMRKEGWLQIVHPEEREENERLWQHSVETGEDFIFQHRFRNRNGEYRWQLSRAIPQKDAEGNIELWIGTSTDIHEHKLFEKELNRQVKERTLELENMNKELKRSNENLEEFAYAASHDLKEPIRKINYFSNKLKMENLDSMNESGIQTLQRLETAAERMRSLVDDLLEYSQVSRTSDLFETVDLNDTIKIVLHDLEMSINDKAAIIETDKLPIIRGHRRQLQQLFENVIGNAIKYSKQDLQPRIKITLELAKGAEIAQPLKPADLTKDFYLIKVIDNGIGFDQMDADRIFQVFTRLHGNAEYSGTGVGLSIAKKVVENHKGFIYAESSAGNGATFNIVLPVTSI